MKEILYLASKATLPGSANRRSDAYEHDQMIDALAGPFGEKGYRLSVEAWDAPDLQPDRYAAALIGTTWDYYDRPAEFLETLEHVARGAPLFNSASIVAWNLNKRYLRELSQRGIATVPTLWLEKLTSAGDVEAVFDYFAHQLGTDDLVFKRQIGAGSIGQVRLKRSALYPNMPHPMMVQPFLPSIVSEGEFSFIFVDGAFSHALIKRPAEGDYRIQSAYGGREVPIDPAAVDLEAARGCLDALDEMPLYARVDMVRNAGGTLCLMELELIEPFLYPLQGPYLGRLLIDALNRHLS